MVKVTEQQCARLIECQHASDVRLGAVVRAATSLARALRSFIIYSGYSGSLSLDPLA
jgi:hypothetical protein